MFYLIDSAFPNSVIQESLFYNELRDSAESYASEINNTYYYITNFNFKIIQIQNEEQEINVICEFTISRSNDVGEILIYQ